MKKILILTVFIFCSCILYVYPQSSPEITVELLTVGPGTATYSIYGHSALRIIIPAKGTDVVYNWGVFDFNTKFFAWKFAKGRLNYMLAPAINERFLQEYFFDKRWVLSQKINLEPTEIQKLIELIDENLKPENITYRYDFFYDNCSTRIRDILEKAVGENLLYPPEDKAEKMTFRDKIGKYQRPYPWLKLGVDLLLGHPADKKVSFRDKMFLPIDLMEGLSDLVINRNGRMVPLLQNPVTELDFDSPVVKNSFLTAPLFIFSVIFILILIMTAVYKSQKIIRTADIIIFSVYSLLALLLIFFNFITDHEQTKWNLNMIWISPFILICLASIIMKKEWVIWFRIVFYLSLISFAIILAFPGAFNSAFMPLMLILIIRSSTRADFSWNPLSVQ